MKSCEEIHCVTQLFPLCFVFVYNMKMLILKCWDDIPSYISIGWPIKGVCEFYMCYQTGSRVFNSIMYYSQDTTLCGINKIIGGGFWTGRSYLGWLLLVVNPSTTYSFRVHLVLDLHITNKKLSLNVCIHFFMLSYQWNPGDTSWNMRHMLVVLFLISTCASFSNMRNFDWNPFLVI